MEEFAFQRALAAIWELIGLLNRYIDAQAPWALAKDPARAERLATVLHTLAEGLRWLSVLLAAFLPGAAEAIRRQLGLAESPPRLADLDRWGEIRPGTPVTKGPPLFPRVETQARADARGVAGASPSAGPRISIEEFGRLDLRVAEVVAAEPLPKSKKLLKLTVRLGEETRTVVAGIAGHYRAEELPGRKVVVVANLEPATLMGVESRGMVLAASEGGALALLTLDRDLPPGAKVT
ncbi:MAG: methionine--tRNA ligase subunit beta, partial [Candidatus Rokubacteria bacterium]|nr:methionine--tRNA ligase subunit beta [Candidatus Rokubacteria bacterium]